MRIVVINAGLSEHNPYVEPEHSNRVELIGFYGGDETHALSAWTSTAREMTAERHARLPAMLQQLASAGHHTPFEKSTLHFLVTTDIATHIHIIKHRIGVAVNAESARYKELKDDKHYVPQDWPPHLQRALSEHVASSQRLYHDLVTEVTEHFVTEWESSPVTSGAMGNAEFRKTITDKARKRAKETARYVLPYAHQITADVAFNFRSFMHFVGLRADAHAQREVREVAVRMIVLAFNCYDMNPAPPWHRAFLHSLNAFGWNATRIYRAAEELGCGDWAARVIGERPDALRAGGA
jgi:flavin-dependent thymidylate synthase